MSWNVEEPSKRFETPSRIANYLDDGWLLIERTPTEISPSKLCSMICFAIESIFLSKRIGDISSFTNYTSECFSEVFLKGNDTDQLFFSDLNATTFLKRQRSWKSSEAKSVNEVCREKLYAVRYGLANYERRRNRCGKREEKERKVYRKSGVACKYSSFALWTVILTRSINDAARQVNFSHRDSLDDRRRAAFLSVQHSQFSSVAQPDLIFVPTSLPCFIPLLMLQLSTWCFSF